MAPPPALTGDPRTDWALWRLSLIVAEIAESALRREQFDPMPGELCDEGDPVPITDPHPERPSPAWYEEDR